MDYQIVRFIIKIKSLKTNILHRFTYRLLDISIKKDRNTLIWIRFDAFAKQLINNSQCQEIYVTYVKFIATGKQ